MIGKPAKPVGQRKNWIRICLWIMLGGALAAQLFARDFPFLYRAPGTYIHSKIKSGQKTIHSVAVLPSTVSRVVMPGIMYGELRTEELISEEFVSEATHIVSEALRQRGWQVDESAFSAPALQNNEKLRNLVDYLRGRYTTLVRQMLEHPKEVSKGRYSLGNEVAELAPPPSIDALVFIRSHVMDPRDSKYAALSISLVDPQSGEVLSLCHARQMGWLSRPVSLAKGETIQSIVKELRKVP